MIINLKIPDSLYERYFNAYGSPQHYVMMKKALEEFSDIPTNDRWFGVHGEQRKRIERALDIPIGNAKELADKIERINAFSIEGENIQFDQGELERIDMQAKFHGKTRQEFVRDMVKEIKDTMLEKV